MPGLSPFLLLLAFTAVGLAAWLLGRRSTVRRLRMPRDYFIGLDHLINDRFDHATEVFARMAETDGDSAEIQFALGSLFRRRGEVERAIRIHARLREESDGPFVDQATYALALDYLSAGLMDRAEQLFHEVAARGPYRAAALDQLLRVHEQQRDWADALRVFSELPAPLQAERSRIAAHYLCELAELAIVQADAARGRALLQQALGRHARFARALQLEGRLAELGNDGPRVIAHYLEALRQAPQLTLELTPRALSVASPTEQAEVVRRVIEVLAQRSDLMSSDGITWSLATLVPRAELEGMPLLVESLRERLTATAGPVSLSRESVLAFVSFAHAAQEAAGRYQCNECGFRSVSWYWQCPSCRTWDSQQPLAFPWADAASRSISSGTAVPANFVRLAAN